MKIPFARTFKGKDFGCIIDGSASSADYLNQRIVSFAVDYGFDLDDNAKKLLARFDYDVTKEDDSEMLNYLSDEAVEYLNDSELPSYSGFTVEDNSLFLMAYVDSAKGGVGFVSSKSQDYPDDDYEGEWLHISDHGNATLYIRGIDNDGKIVDDEIWSIV
jgi:hypothetical protein